MQALSSDMTNSDGSGLHIECIDRFDRFMRIRKRWDALEATDPESTVFLSWSWLAQAFRNTQGRWRVLAVFRGRRLVAVLPLRYRVSWSKTESAFHSKVDAGGRLLWSDYTGFLCAPADEDQALELLARTLAGLPWSHLSLCHDRVAERSHRFAAAFPGGDFTLSWDKGGAAGDMADNLISPVVDLPETFETYLAQNVRANTRQKIRRFTRKYLDTAELRFQVATPDALRAEIGTLLRLWMMKWAPVRGVEVARQAAANYLRVLMAADRIGALMVSVLKRGDQTLGALGHVLDHRRGRVHFLLAGRDLNSRGGYIGLLLHACSINWAIENGYCMYDFGHGNEPYKYSFGARGRNMSSFTLTRRVLTSANGLDPLCQKELLARTRQCLKAGALEQANIGCRQLYAMLD